MKGCFKGCAAIVLMMIFLSAVVGYFLWQAKPKIIQVVRTVVNMPVHGKKDNIDQHYGELIIYFVHPPSVSMDQKGAE